MAYLIRILGPVPWERPDGLILYYFPTVYANNQAGIANLIGNRFRDLNRPDDAIIVEDDIVDDEGRALGIDLVKLRCHSILDSPDKTQWPWRGAGPPIVYELAQRVLNRAKVAREQAQLKSVIIEIEGKGCSYYRHLTYEIAKKLMAPPNPEIHGDLADDDSWGYPYDQVYKIIWKETRTAYICHDDAPQLYFQTALDEEEMSELFDSLKGLIEDWEDELAKKGAPR